MKVTINEKGQAVAPQTQPIDSSAFEKISTTQIRWLGGAGIMLNSRGTTIMIDPVLEGFDMPLLIDMPMLPKAIPHLDGILVTHIDNDHFSKATCTNVSSVCDSYHAPYFVASEMKKIGIPGTGHSIHDSFKVGEIAVTLTPVEHNWQSGSKKYEYRQWLKEDYCGYWLDCPDGTVYLPGDSRLLPEQLNMPEPDVILFDFADNEWHITLEGAITLANTYPNSDLICIHWGSVDAPEMSPFNGNPENLMSKVIHPERIKVLAPGEAYQLGAK